MQKEDNIIGRQHKGKRNKSWWLGKDKLFRSCWILLWALVWCASGLRCGVSVFIYRAEITQLAQKCGDASESYKHTLFLQVVSDRDYSLSDIGYSLSDIGYSLSDIGYSLSDIGYSLSDIGYLLSEHYLVYKQLARAALLIILVKPFRFTRVFHSTPGLCWYWHVHKCAFGVPPSLFTAKSLHRRQQIAPWRYINLISKSSTHWPNLLDLSFMNTTA
jgi:hypothetical protein